MDSINTSLPRRERLSEGEILISTPHLNPLPQGERKTRHHLAGELNKPVLTDYGYNRRPIFAQEENALILWNVINQQRERGRFYLLEFVIMPEHLHLIIILKGEIKISFIMQEIKKGSARIMNRLKNELGKVWMDEYYAHIIRDEEELIEKIIYIHNNPVKRGLIENERKYAFSSANPKYERFLFRDWKN